jgi:hypothetical protein
MFTSFGPFTIVLFVLAILMTVRVAVVLYKNRTGYHLGVLLIIILASVIFALPRGMLSAWEMGLLANFTEDIKTQYLVLRIINYTLAVLMGVYIFFGENRFHGIRRHFARWKEQNKR